MNKVTKLLVMCLLTLSLAACGTANNTDESATGSNTPAGQDEQKADGNKEQNKIKQYDKEPEMTLDINKNYQAVIDTNKGSFTIELFAKDAPKAVNNFIFLAKDDFYDGVTFHRIMKSFMIQTGDPLGNGTGGPGYQFEDELNNGHQYEKGVIAMANAGPHTNGSQFFIGTGKDVTGLNSQPFYTIFGKVIDGMDTVDKIASTPVKAGNMGEVSTPTEEVVIKDITIKEVSAEKK
ncbi:peptidylprolyl isomerase [Brevibacillus daliensis]|uniref:peptidylprolyl isomerase n=1 Tax=Brevibacillus daliensis TaxID=2892995 RepID=UPI001E4E8132|nr:peptidylprolyl isomerase [Brevibacillus daliensis]